MRGRLGALRANTTRPALLLIELGPGVILAGLWVALSLASPYFLTSLNFTNMLQASAVVAVLAIGQLVVLLTGGIDLSVGSTVALAGIVGAKLAQHGAGGVEVAAAMLAIGAAVGLVNAIIIVTLRFGSPFVVTLGMLSAVSGIAYVVSNGNTINAMPQLVTTIGAGKWLGLPVSTFVVAGVALLFWVLTTYARWGRWVYAIGGNREAAKRLGIPVEGVSMSVYVLNGLTAGVAAIFAAGITGSGYPTAGQQAELSAISAVVIGGAALTGGRGTVLGALVGALILATITNGLNILNVNTNWSPVVLGGVLVLAVGADLLRGRLGTKLRLAEARQQGALDAQVAAEPAGAGARA
jgi:ribose/xylose/arabinose/galactoside ABC-type transport system permease subunit